jgi:hypothetical protein
MDLSPRSALATVRGRLAANAWVIAQSGVAAGLSWWLAQTFLHQPQTAFAPFAAIVVLLGGTGGRGPRALRVVLGVSVGVGVGELLVGVTDRGPLSLAVAGILAMTLVSTVSPGTLPVIHAGTSSPSPGPSPTSTTAAGPRGRWRGSSSTAVRRSSSISPPEPGTGDALEARRAG